MVSDERAMCDCATAFTMRVGRADEYRRAKTLLNTARHPTFVGRGQMHRWADEGGLLFAQYHGEDVAVCVMNTRNSTFVVFSVIPEHQSHGLGGALLRYLRPNFARVIDYRVAWFERNGYVSLGEPKQGRKYATQIMVRADLVGLSGRIRSIRGSGGSCSCEDPAHAHG